MKVELKQPQAIYELGQRANQEDNIWPKVGQATDKDFFFILCDGMGGHEHGEVASRIVSETLAEYLRTHANPDTVVDDQLLLDALEAAYVELDRADDEAAKKMGTTLCLLLFHRGGLTTLHIGDSRIYHIRPAANKLLYQSKDHSLVYDLYQAGEITYEEMATSPQKNIITRAMQPGKDNRCRPAMVHITDLKPGDYLYICSDGMLEQMDNDALCRLFSSKKTDEEKRLQLIEATKDNKDNHSAYFVAVGGVMTGEGDENLLDDEQTSKDNALNIPRILSAVEEDVEVVAQPVEEPVQQGVRMDYHGSKSPKNNGNAKAKIILGAVLALAVLACCYLFLGGKKEKTDNASAPATEKLGDTHYESDPSAIPTKPITRGGNADGPARERIERSTESKGGKSSKRDDVKENGKQKADSKASDKTKNQLEEAKDKLTGGASEDPYSASKGDKTTNKGSEGSKLKRFKESQKRQSQPSQQKPEGGSKNPGYPVQSA